MAPRDRMSSQGGRGLLCRPVAQTPDVCGDSLDLVVGQRWPTPWRHDCTGSVRCALQNGRHDILVGPIGVCPFLVGQVCSETGDPLGILAVSGVADPSTLEEGSTFGDHLLGNPLR